MINIDDTMIKKIKEASRTLVINNIVFPSQKDYFLIEQAMLIGASIAFQTMLKEPINKIELHKDILSHF